jgi:hypothetical protein
MRVPETFRKPAIGPPVVLNRRLHGVRRWQISRDAAGALWLGAGTSRWNRNGETTAASCRHRRAHSAPAERCSCGLYAVHPRSSAWFTGRPGAGDRSPAEIFGIVEGWDRVQLYAGGFRARYARPSAIALIGAPRQSEYGRIVEDVAIAYRAALLELDELGGLFAYCGREKIGLPESEVRSLIRGVTRP